MTREALADALRLIVILDHAAARGRDLAGLAADLTRAGATMLQVRAKTLGPGDLAGLTRRVIDAAGRVPVVVNDRLDVALATGAAGCHLGQDDLPLDAARKIAPAGFIIGGSAGTAEEAHRAVEEGCEYLGIGPIHRSPSKPDAGEALGVEGFTLVRRAARDIPCVAVGGIRPEDVTPLRAAGAAGVAVIGAVLGAPDPVYAMRLMAAADAAAGQGT